MAGFSIDGFTSKLSSGGALSSLFRCTLENAKGSGTAEDTWAFLCKGVSFPASTIEAATVTYMGRALNIPSNRAAAQITTSVYNDEDMAIRNQLENWMEKINSHKTNVRDSSMKKITGNDSYTATMHIEQLKKEGGDEGTKKYTFVDVWPSSTGEIALSWDTNEIQTYDITWEFNYWKSAQGSVGQ